MHKKLQLFFFLKRAKIILPLCLLGFIDPLYGIIDNRFRDPALNNKAFIVHDPNACTLFEVETFVETGRDSLACNNEIGLFAFGNPYKLREIDKALIASGRTTQSLIPSYWLGILTEGPYALTGHLQTQGFAFHVRQKIAPHWEVGLRGEVLHANTHLTLIQKPGFDKGFASQGNQRELQLLQESIHQALQVVPALWSDTVVGDFELYTRLFTQKNYAYKCRFIETGLSLGIILPAAPARNIFNPASIPLGGNRHWGWFIEGDVDAILRYDMRAGFAFRVQKRFARVEALRAPTGNEPSMYGAIVGKFDVHQGVTVMFAPYFIQEGLRDGFGIRLAYMGVKHFSDSFSPRCLDQKTATVNFDALKDESKWGKDYVTVSLLYDFAYGKIERCFEPVIELTVDAPVDFWATERAAKTFGIAFVLEMNY